MAVKGQLRQPTSPMPAQHQEKPGMEHRMKPHPKYIAPAFVFFASEADRSFITGEVLVLYGGTTMG
ncbi:MAG: hypothetical protein J0I17_09020 ['Candidatus Kapabacteria' thiocyanatum]|nr:hypothetical protein ['Candidatus Kapabacteria' thiocyanatum]